MSSRAQSWQVGVLVALAVLTAGAAQAQIGPGPFAAFPTGDVIDGRFLGFGCTGIATFEQEVNIGMAAPADQVDFAINFFDGDTGKPDFAGKQHWDLGTRQLVYRLYADPLRQGTHAPANLIGEWRGNSSNPLSGPFWDASGNFTADNSMPDNDWWGVTVTNMPLAQAPSGHYFYNLSITTDGVCNTSPAEQLVSNMKIAASNPLTFIMPRFAFEAGLRQIINDSEIIYPGLTFPVTGDGFLNANTNYDGTFSFFINLPPGETDLKLFDGDFDFGTLPNLLTAPSNRLILPCLDLDDLDTPANYSNLPFPATGATPEGISLFGSPADDVRADAFRRGEAGSFARLGCVRYEVIDPLGNIYNNFNPSGSFEWEQFRIATGSAPNPFDADYTVPGTYLPAGTWIIRTIGLDMSNLNFWAADACAVRPSEGGGSIVSRAKGNVIGKDYRDFDTGGLEPACPEINSYLLGDTVYFDLDGDGTQDPGDAGVPGVILNLYKEVGGPIVGTVTTGDVLNPNWPACVANNTGLDTDGLYCFGTDEAGTYLVEVASENFNIGGVLAGYTSTSGGNQQMFSLVDANVLTFDFGYAPTGGGGVTIGDRIWRDNDGDGTQDAGEPGINGVTVELVNGGGTVINSQVTAGNGIYQFTGVTPGNYTVRVVTSTLPPALVQTYDLDGLGSAHQAAVTVADVDRDDIDFGYRGTASLGDRVWYDSDGDGIQDGGEAGINGVTVDLLDGDGNVVSSQVTAGDGNYTFGNLVGGSYTVRVVAATLPAGVTPTYDLDGIGTAHTAAATLADGATRNDVDFGYRGTGSLGDRVWTDSNGDGIEDGGEAGINGVTVELLDGGGNVIATTVTAGDGNYTFFNLDGGTYTVRVVAATLPAGLAPTYDLDGIGTPHVAATSLAAGASRTDVDFGYRPTGSLGDRVWYDANGNAAQDGGEAGINGVTVELLDGGGNVIGSTVTAGDGNYTFSNLGAGTYVVRVVAATLPAGLAPTYDLDGIGSANLAGATLAGGQNRTDVDFGYRGTASLGDRVWYDADGDGAQEAGEDGINGVTVELMDGGGNVIATTTTTGDGDYTFTNLAAGSYSVRVVSSTLPAGLTPTYDLDGIGTAHTAAATLTGGQSRTDVDFGYRGTASLGDRVWYDTDGDGAQDGGEVGINGLTVELLNGGGTVIATTTTAGDGDYSFANLAAGSYTVRVVSSTLPAGYTPTYDLDGIGSAHTAAATLAAGANRTDVDFGYRGTASLGDRVWTDKDGDGVQDAGEVGINDVTVELLNGNGDVIATTTTAGDGAYTFENLAAGTYTVRVVSSTLPAGVAPTYDLDGVGTAHTAVATLTAGQHRTDVDFGYRGTASLGDRVWYDADGDGTQDAGEAGINGVTVELLDDGATVIATTVTAGDGLYTFSNLSGGTYTVRVVSATLPAGLAATYDLDGTGTVHTAATTLAAGQNRTDVDFGYRGTGSLGDRLWYDGDGDGAQDVGEAGLNGVTVELRDGGGNLLATTVTAGDGNYTFTDLAAGSYSVRVVSATLPAGLAPTYDLDGIGSAHTAAATLTGGQNRTDVDFGYRGTGAIGDRVWNDADGDGVQDGGEAGLNGVTVELLDGDGTVISTAITAGNGNYTFGNLAGGTYRVRVVASTLPAGFAQTYDLDGLGTSNIATVSLAAGQSRTDVDFGYRTAPDMEDCAEESIGDGYNVNPHGHAFYLPGIAIDLAFAPASGHFSTSSAGTAHLTGVVRRNSDLASGFTVDVVFTGYQVAPPPGSPKKELSSNAYVENGGPIDPSTWWYYNNWSGTMTGFGAYAGTVIQITRVDAAFQVGNGANGKNVHFGGSGWFTWNVTSQPSSGGALQTTGQGDINIDIIDCPQPASVGDRVWSDSNGDGVQDPGEPDLPGVTVELVYGGVVIATTTTDANGNYTFQNVAPGSYAVRVVSATLPAGYTPTYDLDGTGTPHTAAVTVVAGVDRTDVDFGYRGTGSLGDRVWLDIDGDGVQDAGEPGINDVTVELLNGGGTVIATTTTAGNGNYTFGNLSAGSYSVRVVSSTLPAGVAPTYDLDGIGSAHVAAATVAAGQNRTDVDFGYRGTGSLGDRVWLDVDGDGVQDAGETGLNGVTVQLLDGGGTVIATATTAGNGNYTFSNLSAGSYSVRVVSSTLPAGLAPTYDLDGIATAHVAGAALTAGQSRTDVDFGYRGTASLGDRVWLDKDADGVQDAGETGLNGVTVELLSGATVIATTTTAGDGNYTFSNLSAGTYSVRVVSSTLPAGLAPSYDLDGIGSAHVAAATLTAGQNRTDVDFGYRGTGSLGDRVWLDKDADGVQDASETGINGVTVELLNSGGTVIATTTTAGNGNYTFSNLPAGSYHVRVVSSTLPAGLAPTFDLDGIATAHNAAATLTAGQNRTDVDFGYRGTGSLGDRLWIDTDADGNQDSGEAGINGATVQLLDSGGNVIATTTTAGNGNYTFSNLPAGSYTVRVVSSTLPAGLAPSFDLDGIATAHTAAVSLTAGQNRTDVDFGYRGTASIGDRVWKDLDGDGTQDASEPGINGVTVQLLNSGGSVIATTTTAGDGNYTFSNLLAGSYSVRVVSSSLPGVLVPTYDLDGIATAHTTVASLAAGQNRTDVDFGYRAVPACVVAANYDPNYLGVAADHAVWLPGIDTHLVFEPNPGSWVTNSDGTARLTGTLRRKSDPSTGFIVDVTFTGFTTAPPAGSPKKELNANAYKENGGPINSATWWYYTGYTGTLTGFGGVYGGGVISITRTGPAFQVGKGANGKNLNFGAAGWFNWTVTTQPTAGAITATGQGDINIDIIDCQSLGSIGDRVWKDTDGDGIQDSSEVGISGVKVELLYNNAVIATDTTDSSGVYTFTNLAAATYKVRVVSSTLPSNYTQTYDLDGVSTGHIATVVLTAGQNRTDADFGYKKVASCTAGYYKDNFNSASFSNNDGNLNWSAAWVENDSAGSGVSSGNVTVGSPYSGYLFLRDNPDTGTQPSAARQASLSGFTSATLSFSFHVRTEVDPDDAVVVEVSKNGGSSYTALETLSGFSGSAEGTRSYNISSYIASNFRVRFRVSSNYGGDNEYFKLDWVKVDGGCN